MGVRIGVVGLGFFGKILLDVLRQMPGVEVVAVHDRFAGKADEIDLQGARFFGKLEDLFEKQPMDAVVIAEIPGYHRRATELAVARGVHVYCEKPMANTVVDCDAMIDVCAKNRVKLMIGFKHRFAKAMSHARAQLPRLGQPYWGMYTYPLWKVEDPGWKFDENGTKGIVVENMVHAFDIMRYFFGDFRSLYAEGDTFVYPNTKLPDSAVMVVRFQNGAIGAIGGGCTSERRVTREYLDMHFERGIVQVSGKLDEPYNLRILMRDEPLPEDHYFEGSDGIREEMRHFVECIQENREPACTGADGRKAVEIALAAVDSIRSHKPAFFG
jgi:predicted dehydrogenase